MAFCSVGGNYECNFGKGHYEERFWEIILNMDQCFRRKIFHIKSSHRGLTQSQCGVILYESCQ